MPCLASLVFDMQSKEGHLYAYNESLATAAHMIGWHYVAAVTTNWQGHPLPPEWVACLERRSFRPARTPWGKASNLYALSDSIARFLKAHILPRNEPAVLFLEHFYPAYLLALLLALARVPHAHLSVWLLYRTNFANQPGWGRVHLILARIAERMLGRHHLRLVTDSNLFKLSLSKHFVRPVHVVPVLSYVDIPVNPVPDGTLPTMPPAPACGDRVVCWWPGPPRRRKGWDSLHYLTQLGGVEARQLCIVAAERSHLAQHHPDGCQVALIGNHLNREQYVAQLLASDLILLPYDPAEYAEKTSGIFTESIIAGKVVAVMDGTWMAYEARKYGLERAIIPSWDTPDLAATLLALACDGELRQRIHAMQQDYRRQNGAHAYAEVIQQLWAHSTW
jgi:hypothetical protein